MIQKTHLKKGRDFIGSPPIPVFLVFLIGKTPSIAGLITPYSTILITLSKPIMGNKHKKRALRLFISEYYVLTSSSNAALVLFTTDIVTLLLLSIPLLLYCFLVLLYYFSSFCTYNIVY